MCVDIPLWACRRREKASNAVSILTQRFFPLLRRAKYFHGKKVNGEIEIRVEQVGWSGTFRATTLTFLQLEPFPGAPWSPILCGSNEPRLPKHPGLHLGVSFNSRIIWSNGFQAFCFSSRTFLQRKSQAGAHSVN